MTDLEKNIAFTVFNGHKGIAQFSIVVISYSFCSVSVFKDPGFKI